MATNYPCFNNPRPLLTPFLVDAITGWIPTVPFPFVGVSEDGKCLLFSHANDLSDDEDRGVPCHPQSLTLLQRLGELVAKLAREGTPLQAVIIDVESNGDLAVRSRSDTEAKLRVKRLSMDDLDSATRFHPERSTSRVATIEPPLWVEPNAGNVDRRPKP